MSILQEIYQSNNKQIDEGIGKTVAAGTLAAAMAMPGAAIGGPKQPESNRAEMTQELPKDEVSAIAKRMKLAWPEMGEDSVREKTADDIADHYRVDNDMVKEIVKIAHEHQSREFPTAKDILAIIGVESSFNPNSKSGLRYDPAIGLMQVRPGIWNIDKSDLSTMESQIKTGADILRLYYKKTGNAEDAIQAYNLGITNFRKGHRNANYVAKYNNFLQRHF